MIKNWKRSKLSDSAQLFLDNTGHDIIHLFNDVLLEKDDLISIINENDGINLSPRTPGLIIQAYLVLVKIFNLDVMEPLKRVKEEVQVLDTGIVFDEDPEDSNQLTIENVSQEDSGLVKTLWLLQSKILALYKKQVIQKNFKMNDQNEFLISCFLLKHFLTQEFKPL